MPSVGLAGIGLLGSAIAERLRAAGHTVIGLDPNPAHHAAADRIVPSCEELRGQAAAIVLCLPDSSITDTLIPDLCHPGLLILDTTTGTPDQMASFGKRLHGAGAHYLDCTIAASSVQVRQGLATALVGGEADYFEQASGILASFCQKTFHLGGWGAGARMKLVVNLALGLQRAVLGEALGFAEACGIDPAVALEVLIVSPAYSRAMDMKGERMVQGRYGEPDARLRQHHKDVRLILEEAARHKARVPLSELHDHLLNEAGGNGWGELDNSIIRELFRINHMA